MSDRCVYEHWRPDVNQCFYVGKGRVKRAYYDKGRNNRWHHVVNKLRRNGLSHEVRIIKAGLTDVEAIDLEIECIKFWKEIGVELTNMTDGGEGAAGLRYSNERRAALSAAIKKAMTAEVRAKISANSRSMSAETRAKISHNSKNASVATRAKLSAAHKGGRPHSAETRAKISAVQLGKVMSAETRTKLSVSGRGNKNTLGYRHSEESKAKIGAWSRGRRSSEETKAKISAANKGRHQHYLSGDVELVLVCRDDD